MDTIKEKPHDTPLSTAKERNRIVFDNEALSIQRLKISFVCNLFSWSKTCLDGEPCSLINFVDWLGSN